jgi:GT2 family glycosyltransferase
MSDTAVVIPNWNGLASLGDCIDSLLKQTLKTTIIVVENGSIDGSLEFLKSTYPQVQLVVNKKNLGFAGGVNSGIRLAVEKGTKFIALFNNDALADKKWLESLYDTINSNNELGIVTSKITTIDGSYLDSTGDFYTTWGLPYPRGRDEKELNKYDNDTVIFAASGGASIYRTSMLNEIGLFDEDFFAYYEDVDISFRAQLYGWKVGYEPKAVAYHSIGVTSGKIKGFTTYQTMKNLPMLFWKNVPLSLMPKMLPRFKFAYYSFLFSAFQRKQGLPAIKGIIASVFFIPKKTIQRYKIQNHRKVSVGYIRSVLVYDLPPNARKLKALRAKWWRITGRSE